MADIGGARVEQAAVLREQPEVELGAGAQVQCDVALTQDVEMEDVDDVDPRRVERAALRLLVRERASRPDVVRRRYGGLEPYRIVAERVPRAWTKML